MIPEGANLYYFIGGILFGAFVQAFWRRGRQKERA